MSSESQIRGTCNCGAITLSIPESAFPPSTIICHCTNCRASCGSLFSVNLRVMEKDVVVEKGQTKTYADKGSSGKDVTRHFCGNCGSPVFSLLEVDPGAAYVKGGLFRKMGVDLPGPGVQIWHKNHEVWEKELVDGVPIFKEAAAGSA